jgi:A/G-specific adenine glycosylase
MFTKKLLTWYKHHGRKDLPWQKDVTPYRIWVSEIMLQQTQVSTVIAYYEKFMQHFPNLADLADAHIDDVLQLWAGLGYYSRARNLHKTAQIIMSDFSGEFPNNLEGLMKLPGIGRSTAGAILAFSFHQSHPILDGNVKRVLSRFYATEVVTWEMAEQLTPGPKQVAQYTQAIMDFGATLCTRSKPKCDTCPMSEECRAYQTNMIAMYPPKKIKKAIPTKHSYFLILLNENDEILLYRRPEYGIWGGLWSLPEAESMAEAELLSKKYLKEHEEGHTLPEISHSFSHYTLIASPIIMIGKQKKTKAMSIDRDLWYKPQDHLPKGVPALITKILKELSNHVLPKTKKRR